MDELGEHLAAATAHMRAATEEVRKRFTDASHGERMRWASALAEYLKAIRGIIDPFLYPPLPYGPGFDFDWLKNHAHRQTLTFYVDIWETVFSEVLRTRKKGVRILDVGSGSGIGAELLAVLLSNAFGIKCEITANDYSDNYAPYARAYFDRIKFIAGPVQNITENFDLVLCSHLIEHFEDPFPFIEYLRRLATDAVILYAPFAEDPLSHGHFYSFCETDLHRMGARFHKVIASKAWSGQCFIAVLDPVKSLSVRDVRQLVDMGAYREAIELLMQPDMPLTGMNKYLLGFSLCQIGRHAEAESHLREALALDGEAVYPNLMLAYSREAMGDPCGADRYLDKCEAVEAGHPAVIAARELFAAQRGNF